MSTSDYSPGLAGVIALETEIAEPDREGGALRYRGVDIEDLVGHVPFEQVWGLLVDGTYVPGLPPAEPFPLTVRSGDPRVDVQSALAMLAPEWGFKQLIDIDDATARDQLARASVMALSFVAQSARGGGQPPVSQHEVDKGESIPERFLIRWRGEANPDHAKAIDAYWISAAEHGMNASTFTARVIVSTLSDIGSGLVGAIGALKGRLHGGAPSHVSHMIDEIGTPENAEPWLRARLDANERLMGFGHRVYRTYDPRARALGKVAGSVSESDERLALARHVEETALRLLQEYKPHRPLYTNVEYYAAAVLGNVDLAPDLYTATFAAARTAGWTAHMLEQLAHNRLIRPQVDYVGPLPAS